MKVLLISSNTLPASPSGPAYVAGAVRQAGHEVSVYESLFALDLPVELATRLTEFRPDVVGISIRITPAILTKRGCAFGCTYCPYSKLEGKRYRLKSPERVLAEIRHLLSHTLGRRIMICDNNFNVPRRHAEALCRAFIATADSPDSPGFSWGTGDLRPMGITDEFCRLLHDSGCFYASLAVESASDTMLRRMKRGYTARDVRASLEALSGSPLPFGASLMFGAAGETPDTIAETLAVMSDYDIPQSVWVTLGIYLWTDLQDIVAEARQAGVLETENGRSLFDGPVYFSPDLPVPYLVDLIGTLRARPGYTVQVNRADLFEQRMAASSLHPRPL